MTGISTKELWTVKGKPMSNGYTLENSLYGFSGNPLTPYKEESIPPKYCIFVIRGTDGRESGWLFQNDEVGGQHISEKLHEFISGERKTMFYRCQHPPLARTKECLSLHDLLYAFKYSVNIEQVKKFQVRLVDTASGISFGDTQIFDLTWDNLKSNQKPTALFISDGRKEAVLGTVLHGTRTMCSMFLEPPL